MKGFEYQPGHQGVCRGTKWCQVLGRFYTHKLLVWSGSCVSAGGDESTLQVTLLPKLLLCPRGDGTGCGVGLASGLLLRGIALEVLLAD